jgi:hypothetical protein
MIRSHKFNQGKLINLIDTDREKSGYWNFAISVGIKLTIELALSIVIMYY